MSGGCLPRDIGPANQGRPDVAPAYPYGGASHGFDRTLTTDRTGTVPVCVYGINLGDGGNVALPPSCRSVVVTPPGPPNDDFADASPLNAAAGAFSASFTTTNASLEPAEPTHMSGNGPSVWYSYASTSNGVLTIDTAGTAWDTVLAAYSGATLAQLQLIAMNDDIGGTLQSRLQLSVTAGQRVSVAVTGFSGQSGTGVLIGASSPAPRRAHRRTSWRLWGT